MPSKLLLRKLLLPEVPLTLPRRLSKLLLPELSKLLLLKLSNLLLSTRPPRMPPTPPLPLTPSLPPTPPLLPTPPVNKFRCLSWRLLRMRLQQLSQNLPPRLPQMRLQLPLSLRLPQL